MTDHDDAAHNRCRFRVYLAGELAEEAWPAAEGAEALGVRHAELTEQATADGTPWLVEVFCPDCPPDAAYYRWGTDTAGMVTPIPAPR